MDFKGVKKNLILRHRLKCLQLQRLCCTLVRICCRHAAIFNPFVSNLIRSLSVQIEQGTNTSLGGPKNDVPFTRTSTGMKQVLDFLKHIKAKLLKSSNKKEDSRKLQIQFYSHIKSWLAPRVSRVVENELSDVLGRMDTFDSAIEELEAPECDEELTCGFTTLCENIIKSCKKDFPLKNLN